MAIRHSEEYDAYYDDKTKKWLEPKCNDPKCDYCKKRPRIARVNIRDRIVPDRFRPSGT